MMAEFVDVMRAAQRMCGAQSTCEGCPAEGRQCIFMQNENEDRAMAEQIVMDWAKAHPEKVYPSWIAWQQAYFPDARCTICPMVFGCECAYAEAQCPECVRKPIPEGIAKKLGIAPISWMEVLYL